MSTAITLIEKPKATPTHAGSFRAFGPLGETKAGVKQLMPHSVEWSEMMVEKRLEKIPYLVDLIKTGKARLMFYDRATSTCQEKAEIAGIDITAVYKALVVEHFDPSSFESILHMVVTDGTKKVDIGKLFSSMEEFEGLGIDSVRRRVKPSKTPPTGMPFGTIGPLIGKHNEQEIGRIIMKRPNGESDMEVDISIGDVSLREAGEGEEISHRFSVRIKYCDLVDVLSRIYPDKVHIVESIPAN